MRDQIGRLNGGGARLSRIAPRDFCRRFDSGLVNCLRRATLSLTLQTIIIYTKPNCLLCDEALEEIEAARQLLPFRLEQVDILNNLALYEKYKHDIPVLCLNGREIFRHRVTREELMEKLQQCGRPGSSIDRHAP